jgi:hypothetical protein
MPPELLGWYSVSGVPAVETPTPTMVFDRSEPDADDCAPPVTSDAVTPPRLMR